MTTSDKVSLEDTHTRDHLPPTPVKRMTKRSRMGHAGDVDVAGITLNALRVTDDMDEAVGEAVSAVMEEEGRLSRSQEKRRSGDHVRDSDMQRSTDRKRSTTVDGKADDMFFDITDTPSFLSPILPSPSQDSSKASIIKRGKRGT